MKINPKEFVSVLQPLSNLEQRNQAFDALSDEEKRREIAYDCLKLMLLGKLSGSNGGYWDNSLEFIEEPDPKKFQEILVNELPDDCEVCARGGMMLSQIRLGNKISSDDCDRYNGNPNNINGFAYKAFREMEKEYEFSDYEHPYNHNTTEKLQNICLNVIANGDFNMTDKTDYLIKYLEK